MADFLEGKQRRYTCVPTDSNGNPAQVDLSNLPIWAVADPTLITLAPDPGGNLLINIGTAQSKEGDTTVSCTFDADRGPGVPRNVTVTSAVQHVVAPSATGGTITEQDL